jgi:hypothetical protein
LGAKLSFLVGSFSGAIALQNANFVAVCCRFGEIFKGNKSRIDASFQLV